MSQEITDQNFSTILKSNNVVVVDFHAKWCGPCKGIAPMIEDISREFDGRAVVGKLDVDMNPLVTGSFGIRNIPAILFFKNGKLVDRIGAVSNKGVISQKINSLL